MSRPSVKLHFLQKKSLYAVLAILWLSGLLWLYYQYLDHLRASIVPPGQTWSLKIHGAAAMAFLVVLGALIPNHIQMAWGQKRNRAAGVSLLALNAVLIVSGWMLYYGGSEALRVWVSSLHWVLGLLLPLFVYLHILWARKYPK